MSEQTEKLEIEFRKAKKVLIEARKICIISHRSPDGDAVGSNLALRLALEEMSRSGGGRRLEERGKERSGGGAGGSVNGKMVESGGEMSREVVGRGEEIVNGWKRAHEDERSMSATVGGVEPKEIVSASVDPVPQNSMFLKKANTFVQDFNYADFDLIVSVDCGAMKLVAFHEKKPELLSAAKPFINFDHHVSNNNFGTINIVDASACSTCMILYKFMKFCEWPISIDVATCLLHGIYFDTGGLVHSNTTAEVMRVCSELMLRGADLKRVAKELFHTTPVNKLRLWGRILERAYVNEEGVTVSAVNHQDYQACGGVSSLDTGGAIDYLNAVPGSKYCVLLAEDEKGQVKGSLRTQRNDINLSDVAGKWGGGGHPKASGFGMPGKLKPVMSWQILPKEGVGGEGQKEDYRF